MNTNKIASRIAEKLIEDHDGRNLESISALDPETQDEIRSTWKNIIATELKPLVEERDHLEIENQTFARFFTKTAEELTQLRAQLAEANRERCEHCGSDRIYHGPPDCPMCGAPNCCQTCCRVTTLENERDQLKAQLSEAQKWKDLYGSEKAEWMMKIAALTDDCNTLKAQLSEAQKVIQAKDYEIFHDKAQLAHEQEKGKSLGHNPGLPERDTSKMGSYYDDDRA